MLRIVGCVLLCLAINGCWLVERQRVLLDTAQVAAIEASIGELNKQNLEEWIKAAAIATKADVENVTKTTAGIVLELKAPLQEAGETAGESLIESTINNPTPAGIVAGLPAALLAAVMVLTRRGKMRNAGGGK